jgi:hypothetical protein
MLARRRHVLLGAVTALAAAGGLPARSDAPAPAVTTAMNDGAGEVSFNHALHAGTYAMPCLDCHVDAERSTVAGLPSERKCMGCHKFVAKDAPAIQALARRFAAGESLRWPRIFALPDFVYFSHRVHVRAEVACAACHGNVVAEAAVREEHPFTMGRCLACHDERHASRDCVGCHK